MFVTFSSYRRRTSDDEGRSRPGERSSQNSAVAQTQLKLETMSKTRPRTEHTAGPNSNSAQEGSDMSSGGSGTLVIPAFRRATSQTDRDLRDIKTCRRALLVRARFTRSIGLSLENTWGCSGLLRDRREYGVSPKRTYQKQNVEGQRQHVLQSALDPAAEPSLLCLRGRFR